MQLKIEHLSFTYDGAPEAVFADLSLSLDTAWRTGLIARNGRGKTTLLRLLSGDLQGKGKIDCPLMRSCKNFIGKLKNIDSGNRRERRFPANEAELRPGTASTKKGTDIRFIEMMPVGEGHRSPPQTTDGGHPVSRTSPRPASCRRGW